ncbi:MAG: hypothetical protein JXR82_09015 [Marinifilaceae bacterium]|nr:hypothetical protein [Marinifilaceae bacterium]
MSNQIDERIKIAKNFKSPYNWEGNPLEKREKTLRRAGFLDYGFVMILLSVLIVASAMSAFKIDPFISKWHNAGLLVLMTMAFSIRAPFSYIELMLHQHINKIKTLEIEFDEKLNAEFENIVARFNKRKKYIYLTGIPLILIGIAAFLQVFDENPYWTKFPPLVLVISLYLIARINYDILKLKRILGRVINAI